jgi:hypothetical protein
MGGNKLEMASNNLTTLQIIFLSFLPRNRQQGPTKSKFISGEKIATDTHIKTRLDWATVKHDSPVHGMDGMWTGNTFSFKLCVKSSSLSTPVPSAFTLYPLFQWYPQSKEILLNLGMKS